MGCLFKKAHKILEGSYEDVKVYKCNNLEKVSIIETNMPFVSPYAIALSYTISVGLTT